MTEDQADALLRLIIREELLPLLAEIRQRLPPDPEPAAESPVVTWLASAPVPLTGRAAELLKDFLLTFPSPRPEGPWTPSTFGAALARHRDRHIRGRVLRRRADRKGVYVWTIEAVPLLA